MFYLCLEKGKGGRKIGKETSIQQTWLLLECPLRGTWSATQARALTQTGDPLVHKPALNPLSHTSQAVSYM